MPGVSVKNARQREQQRRIVDKVWGMVDFVIGEMRISLGALLRDPLRPVEEQEKIIECAFALRVDGRLADADLHSAGCSAAESSSSWIVPPTRSGCGSTRSTTTFKPK